MTKDEMLGELSRMPIEELEMFVDEANDMLDERKNGKFVELVDAIRDNFKDLYNAYPDASIRDFSYGKEFDISAIVNHTDFFADRTEEMRA